MRRVRSWERTKDEREWRAAGKPERIMGVRSRCCQAIVDQYSGRRRRRCTACDLDWYPADDTLRMVGERMGVQDESGVRGTATSGG